MRIGITGLARSGKTALLTSLAANLLAEGEGVPTLPALRTRLGGRTLRVRVPPAGASGVPRFDPRSHLAALATDPPRWPDRTGTVSLLALDLDIGRSGLAAALPPVLLRLEILDYPGEWLLDLPMLTQDFTAWSAATLRRLREAPAAADFLGFVAGLPDTASDEALARTGHRLYRALLEALRREGRSLLQPGRFVMPGPADTPHLMEFFPLETAGRKMGGLAGLLAARYDAYRVGIRQALIEPGFGRLDRLAVVADLLSALHAGADSFADARDALGAAAVALNRRHALPGWLAWLPDLLPGIGQLRRVVFAATKADHVASRQRGNLAALVATLAPAANARSMALAAIRCTEDFVWSLDGRPVSAVRGRVGGQGLVGSYPGEVPDQPPDAEFWEHPFLAIPDFQPMRLDMAATGGVPHIGLDTLLLHLLDDLL